MANVLTTIIDHKKLEVAERKQKLPLQQFQELVQPSQRNFLKALQQKGPRFILECKKASPSKGLIRSPFDLDEICAAYGQYADCISVLTDEKFFQGSYDYLAKVRAKVNQPLLHKDFIIDSYQIYLGRLQGSDAVLLMLSVLNDLEYLELAKVAKSLKLTVLTEVSNEAETLRAVALGAELIGINNRDLRTLDTNLETSFRLARLIPEGITIVSESGIYSSQQVRQLAKVADAYLVGSSLMAQPDLATACRALIRGEHKVCGLTRPEDSAAAYGAGAYFGGLIFYPKSPRFVSIEHAKTVQQGAPQLHYVGVFVDEAVETVAATARDLKLSAVQLHGDESDLYVQKLRPLLPKTTEIWKAYRVQHKLPELTRYADRYVLDAYHPEQPGGTGEQFNWQLLDEQLLDKKVMLAGGLKPDNVIAALKHQILAVDLNSGLESAPGIKDAGKIQQAFVNIREFSYD
ncbi:MAG: bifunctional indole-3-glycerol-phosphate synthase TrpC/phosphoribosylanthranilate isomerase TrpF [Gammaproteobacteria bacterium]|nr:bifunctional indole-3-glycerol-phosphate synthase TrpC/phosphoribosylanthranilate isomerase TrpF [Gammaproteobacteria bacterium]MBU2058502.1 bifunctional indole-3-glycerol-phosphate synthase TrpC/phosphoribosylanthranilate isomerase TrpF [Gammaproteobacteria bacterium]MBU2175527.1 bifunctional indole-3-glycerol-phosphate synthase TrpC/phosphoribosylanthranilate isomerase TrpF [Gammaproteobacteria bacterium]MBU2248613.1 bifunctional indole-3-glycerol-phosphate synthase TrpC/phosphoribosylanthr